MTLLTKAAAFLEDDGGDGGGGTNKRRWRWQKTNDGKFFATSRSIELVLKCMECVSNPYIYGWWLHVNRMKRYVKAWMGQKKRKKTLAQTQLSKGHNWDRFKLNKKKDIRYFSIFWYFSFCYSLFKKFQIHLVIVLFDMRFTHWKHAKILWNRKYDYVC